VTRGIFMDKYPSTFFR